MEQPSDTILTVAKDIFIAAHAKGSYNQPADKRFEAVATDYVKLVKAIQAGLANRQT
jgi:hypothetical protein